ncbi:MAG: 16S rRNA (cytidine(1402)-2'-O)-methyltransferase [Actinomycetota bacterium]|nr:16S rRNA (cytidine(1402)-2'-O)-methyltransferase [Actinomycetota bacterium]
MPVSFTCHGHPNIAATHTKTSEFTRDAEISRRATCVLGVGSDHDDAALRALRGRVEVTIACEGLTDSFAATMSPFFLGDDSLVFRRAEGLRARTVAFDATKTAADIDRALVDRLTSSEAEVLVTVDAVGSDRGEGALFVVSLPIGNDDDRSVRATDVLTGVDLVLAEDTRRIQGFATRVGVQLPPVLSYHDHNETERAADALERLARGDRIALVSDAGTPLCSDPGYVVVSRAVDAGFAVVPVPGPSAVLAVLAASGLPVDRFVFAGFLSRRSAQRQAELRELGATGLAIVCYEAPTRVARFLADVAAVGPDWRVCIGREVTKVFEEFRHGTAAELAAELEGTARPLGEFAIVIVPGAAPDAVADDDGLLRALLAQGVPASALAAALRDARGMRRNAAYEHVLGLDR